MFHCISLGISWIWIFSSHFFYRCAMLISVVDDNSPGSGMGSSKLTNYSFAKSVRTSTLCMTQVIFPTIVYRHIQSLPIAVCCPHLLQDVHHCSCTQESKGNWAKLLSPCRTHFCHHEVLWEVELPIPDPGELSSTTLISIEQRSKNIHIHEITSEI